MKKETKEVNILQTFCMPRKQNECLGGPISLVPARKTYFCFFSSSSFMICGDFTDYMGPAYPPHIEFCRNMYLIALICSQLSLVTMATSIKCHYQTPNYNAE